MSKYVPDIMSRRWVIISGQRLSRPEDIHLKNHSAGKKSKCPFCTGNEKMTPPEVFRLGRGEANQPGWKVRVIPNKYPITDFHEVVIHSPSENKDIEELSASQVELIFKAFRERYNFYKNKGQVLIFCNHGEYSGASLRHPHSQIVVIPSQINLDALTREPLNNLVDENNFFNVYCPDFSQWPYELWIAPKKEKTTYGEITDEEINDLIIVMQKMLRQLKKIFEKHPLSRMIFGYNFYIYPKENWYLRIIPRFIHRAGFELGTGLSVNVIDPMQSALEFRGEDAKIINVLHKLKKY